MKFWATLSETLSEDFQSPVSWSLKKTFNLVSKFLEFKNPGWLKSSISLQNPFSQMPKINPAKGLALKPP